MADLKNTAAHPVALPGGRVLAPGEVADADLDDAQVAAEVAQGFLTAVQSDAAEKPPEQPTGQEPARSKRARTDRPEES